MTEGPVITRVDKYNIEIDGHRIRSTPEQEAKLRALPPELVKKFLIAMGYEVK